MDRQAGRVPSVRRLESGVRLALPEKLRRHGARTLPGPHRRHGRRPFLGNDPQLVVLCPLGRLHRRSQRKLVADPVGVGTEGNLVHVQPHRPFFRFDGYRQFARTVAVPSRVGRGKFIIICSIGYDATQRILAIPDLVCQLFVPGPGPDDFALGVRQVALPLVNCRGFLVEKYLVEDPVAVGREETGRDRQGSLGSYPVDDDRSHFHAGPVAIGIGDIKPCRVESVGSLDSRIGHTIPGKSLLERARAGPGLDRPLFGRIRLVDCERPGGRFCEIRRVRGHLQPVLDAIPVRTEGQGRGRKLDLFLETVYLDGILWGLEGIVGPVR